MAAEPSKREIEKQVELILSSDLFATKKRPSELFKRLVNDNLEGKVIDERTLGVELFGKPKDWNLTTEGVVRETMRVIRAKIAEYYKEFGTDDLVLLEFKKRQDFRLTYTYNSRATIVAQHHNAAYEFDVTFPSIGPKTTQRITDRLWDCLIRNRNYAPAYATLAEILLQYALCDDPYFFPVERCVAEASWLADKCLSIDPRNWLANVVSGAIRCCHFDWETAELRFSTALDIAPNEARSHFFYNAYLLAVGKPNQALGAIQSVPPTGSLSWLKLALYLYIMRDYREADHLMRMKLRCTSFIAHRQTVHFKNPVCDNWLVELLFACVLFEHPEFKYAALGYAEAADLHSIMGSYFGVRALAMSRHTSPNEPPPFLARRLCEQICNDPNSGPINRALGYMSAGYYGRAVECLQWACRIRHPLMVWLHLWPIFDPLRDDDGFKALIASMNLPA